MLFTLSIAIFELFDKPLQDAATVTVFKEKREPPPLHAVGCLCNVMS